MFNLSTQEVVLSIEKTPVIKEKQYVYQHYHNFFGNLQELELDIGNLNFDGLEKQEHNPRKRLSYNEKLSKQLHVFFMNLKITNALAKKFNTNLRFESVDIWIDNKGYHIPPHVDDSRIKLALQIYLSENNTGTNLYNEELSKILIREKNMKLYEDKKIKTFAFEPNSGYALLNTKNSFHGVEKIEKDGRISLYVRYS